MTFKIKEDSCIKCGGCASVCPAGAIKFKDGAYEVDREKCLSCGACAEACPVDAVSQE